MQCPNCKKNGWLGRVKVLASNLLLRVCNQCTRTWIEEQLPDRVEGIKLKEFIRAQGIDPFHLVDVAEDIDQKRRA
jgi:chromosomal replication initiation ATPase DnaA